MRNTHGFDAGLNNLNVVRITAVILQQTGYKKQKDLLKKGPNDVGKVRGKGLSYFKFTHQLQDITLYSGLTGDIRGNMSGVAWCLTTSSECMLKISTWGSMILLRKPALDLHVILWHRLQISWLREGSLGSISNLLSALGQRMMDNQVLFFSRPSSNEQRHLSDWTPSLQRHRLMQPPPAAGRKGRRAQRTKIKVTRLFLNESTFRSFTWIFKEYSGFCDGNTNHKIKR